MNRKTKFIILELIVACALVGILFCLMIPEFLAAQTINTPRNIPDPNFRKVIEDFMGVEPGGQISAKEAAAKTGGISCISKFIHNIKGIEYFTGITGFNCSCNPLNVNPDISKNTALTDFRCRSSLVTHLDLSKNRALTIIDCFDNNLTTLDLSNNTALVELECGHNSLTSLDLSKNTLLEKIRCGENRLTTLDVSQCVLLTDLSCYSNQLSRLDVSNNTALINLGCSRNHLTSLDLSQHSVLERLGCSENQLMTLDVSRNTALTALYCGGNHMEMLDLARNTALTEIHCTSSPLTALDVSNCIALKSLYLSSNQLEAIPDLTHNTLLDTLDLRDNNLDYSNWSRIEELLERLSPPAFHDARENHLKSGFAYSPQRGLDLFDEAE
ncbi:MAG: hypothetical protein ABIH23_20470 [bacterium]